MPPVYVERFVAIDNVCAWPNLTLMPDGAIVATIFNQPCHGRWEGDVECWASTDGGQTWRLRGVPAPHDPGTNRMNVAAGLAHGGSLVVIASGWSDRLPQGQQPTSRGSVLPPWVCRSLDGGHSWERSEAVARIDGGPNPIPFGDVERGANGMLGVSFYTHYSRERNSALFLVSRDDGHTWGEPVTIGADDYNETDLLFLGGQRWIAASRTVKDAHLDLFVSGDSGRSWACHGPLTLPRQHPAHLSRLPDGRILLVYGIRNRGLFGVGARLSADEGQSWGAPVLLLDLEDATDVGYPSSVQLPDGTIATAYYCNGIPSHRRYHMGVVRWRGDG